MGPTEHWHVASIRTTRKDGGYHHLLRQVDMEYPSALAAATVIARLEFKEFPLPADTLRNLAELLAANPGMSLNPSPDGVGDHYTVLRCVRSGDEDCIETGNEWFRKVRGD